MVQLMESWFLADVKALKSYYGAGFRVSALPKHNDVERVPKADVLKALREAIRVTNKPRYDKASHAPRILELLQPATVRLKARNCERFLSCLG